MKRIYTLILLMALLSQLCLICGCAKDEDVFYADSQTEIVSSKDVSDEVACEGLSADGSIDESVDDNKSIFVYVCGAVFKPGVYELPDGSRVYAAINAAGGLNSSALDYMVNQADFLSDGQQVYVPSSDDANATPAAVAVGSITSDGGIININKASADELMTIPGIGKTKALAIVTYREENGRFLKPEDITKVSGIGDSTYEKIKGNITVK